MAHWDVSSEVRGEHGKWTKGGAALKRMAEEAASGRSAKATEFKAGDKVKYRTGASGVIHHVDGKGTPHVVWDRGRGKPVRTPAHHLTHSGTTKPGSVTHEESALTPSEERIREETFRKLSGGKPDLTGATTDHPMVGTNVRYVGRNGDRVNGTITHVFSKDEANGGWFPKMSVDLALNRKVLGRITSEYGGDNYGWQKDVAQGRVKRVTGIPVDKIRLLQEPFADTVAGYQSRLGAGESVGVPVAVREGDLYVLLDGNHRAAARVAAGARTLNLDLVTPGKRLWRTGT